MRIWIICSGEAALALPPRAAAAEYAALCEKRLDSPVGETQGHPVAANGRGVHVSPRAAARDTAEKLIADGMPQAEPLLDEIPLRPFGGGKLPLWLWRVLVWLRGLFGLAAAESGRVSRQKADELISRLEKRGEDCILVSHPRRIAALCDALRVRGYCVQRHQALRTAAFEPARRALRRLRTQLSAVQSRLQHRPRQGGTRKKVT